MESVQYVEFVGSVELVFFLVNNSIYNYLVTFCACFCIIFSVQWRKDIRKQDDSEFGRLFLKRLNETKEEERQRLIEQKLAEERRVSQQSRRGRGGNVSAGSSRRGGRGGQSSGPAAAQASGTGDNVICSWCQVRGHKIAKCRVLEKDYAEGRCLYDSNIHRYIRLDSQMFANPPPAARRGDN